ncbi:ABC transporter permease [Clavibacter michiganensis]|uniref:ABC transporter permease n=1 Tax=Clavibacter michiganensis TaxID=28447 RepID=UPI0009A58214|nr:ABC transporter permease [Clavibacter michiganensis]MBE3078807.1 ABC transporter permease [Clavibacter michiganensis subsp. michiganensis]MBF4637047.1 ABC transporter permease [Clavibacter michiganensis subsp. michiganensis]MDO4025821.1 ABC transporter permease [Clavibacter michiganensis]MDO4028497.1 ABC transporter permease [Clavibacter michiganensis]MDO4034909.1 ABC transporter permease [Clavibacter michiganensis]
MTALRPAREDVRADDRTGAEVPDDDGRVARRAPGRATGGALVRVGVGLVVPVLVVGLWAAVTATGAVPAHLLPAPLDVVRAGAQLAEQGILGQYVAISLQRVLLGFALGATVGLVLGAVVGLSRVGRLLLAPTAGAFRTVPSLAWVPLLLLWMGINEDSKVTLVAIGAMFPVYTTVAGALRHVDPHLVEVGRAFGLSRIPLLVTVQLPAVLPAVVSGLRLALAQSWLFLVAAELLAASMGLGYLLTESSANGRVDRVLLAIVLLAVLGAVTDAVVGLVERVLVRRWG